MFRYFSSGIFCLAVGLSASGSAAQQQNTTSPEPAPRINPFGTGDNLGNHIATETLNMNGHNVVNLRDPYFQGDAVNLGYLERNMGWNHVANPDRQSNPNRQSGTDGNSGANGNFSANSTFGANRNSGADGNSGKTHIATGAMDFGGFDVFLDDSTVYGGTLKATALSQVEITGGSLTGISMRNSAIEIPHVTGGTFNAPALLGPVMDQAVLTNSEMTGSRFSGEITGSTLSDNTLSDNTLLNTTVTGTLSVQNGRITGLPAPVSDDDAMNRRATEQLVDNRVISLEQSIETLENHVSGLMGNVSGFESSISGLENDILGLRDSTDLLADSTDLLTENMTVMENMVVAGNIRGSGRPETPALARIRNGIAGLQDFADRIDEIGNAPEIISGALLKPGKFDIEAARPDLIFTSISDLEVITDSR